ncbi:hypothetical protein ABT352_38810 [Streptosporangium sp. NPDC000563]|uniref:hypothetical protein n=1 Tax=Streptosporangium sp. NPDC000563 TaxID=3154366 RepID=UPI003327CE82
MSKPEPGPEDVTARYATALRALYAAAGSPTGATITQQAEAQKPSLKVTSSSWSDWLNGVNVPSNPMVATWLIEEFLRPRARQRTPAFVAQPSGWWQETRRAALAQRRQGVGRGGRPPAPHPQPAPEAVPAEGEQVRCRVGSASTSDTATTPDDEKTDSRTICVWRPADLAIHRTLRSGLSEEAEPELPGYLRRSHDERLDRLLQNPADSALIVLRGGSSTGKSRALYEAILQHEMLRDWPLRFPRDARQARKTLDGGLSVPGVLWLGDCQDLLTSADGAAVAADLGALLDGGAAGPVLIVATLWPGDWERLTTEPSARPVRDLLLHQATVVDVPASFTEREMEAVLADPAADRRLVTAVRTAGPDRLVIQTLAGGPLLVSQHEQPATAEGWYARAIVATAMDARRMGMLRPIPPALMRAAAPAYLEGDARIDPPEDWFERGLRRASRDPHYGVTALFARRKQPGSGPADGYDLHDYLVQHGQQSRHGNTVPAVLWEALLAHVDDHEDAFRLALNAEHRLLHRYDLPLYRRCRELGGEGTEVHVVNLMARNGELEEMRAEAAAGSRWAGMRWAYALIESDRIEELFDHAAAGDRYAAEALGDHVARMSDPHLGWDLRVPGADLRAISSAYAQARTLLNENPAAAEQLLSEHARQGFHWAGHTLVAMLDGQGRADDALAALRWIRPTQHPQHWAVQELYGRLAEQAAVTELRELAEQDDGATWALCRALKNAGDADGLRWLADRGNDEATRAVCDLLIERNELEEAATRLRAQFRARPYQTVDVGRFVSVLVRLEQWDEIGDLARGGIREAMAVWFEWRLGGNEITEIAELAVAGNQEAVTYLARWYLDHDRMADAIELVRITDSIVAQNAVVQALVAAGRANDAVALLEYRLEHASPDDRFAIISLGALLDQLGRGWEKYRVLLKHARQPGSLAQEPVARVAAGLNDVATLFEQVVRYGSGAAATQLRELASRGGLPPDQAAALLANGLTPDGEIDYS